MYSHMVIRTVFTGTAQGTLPNVEFFLSIGNNPTNTSGSDVAITNTNISNIGQGPSTS